MHFKNVYIIWSIYFDSSLSRGMGRKLPLKESIPNPRLEELKAAAERLNIKVLESKKARYPRVWWIKDVGYIVIEKGSEKKTAILKKLAKELKKIRSITHKQGQL
ncbi:MAG: signal recognition particle subunit SRP19/SEC65 family protein [Candidatus Geothermarchaeota archaeon]